MIRPPASDLWTVGVVPASVQEVIVPGGLTAVRDRIVWLPDAGPWRYLADPFGLRRGDTTHVFVEAFDYHTKHAVIERHEFGPGLAWRGKEVALERPVHLSYPFLVEDGGEIFMIPESHRANEIALYRARDFPRGWQREVVLFDGMPGADATVLRHREHWWMFFTIVGAGARDQRELHVAFADRLTGPWRRHAQNPVLNDRTSGRPGGTPWVAADGSVTLPVQDCSATYGGAIRLLHFDVLTTERIVVRRGVARLAGEQASATYPDGLHTLSGCGELTLIDVKRIARSWARPVVDFGRRMRNLGRRWGGSAAP